MLIVSYHAHILYMYMEYYYEIVNKCLDEKTDEAFLQNMYI